MLGRMETMKREARLEVKQKDDVMIDLKEDFEVNKTLNKHDEICASFM